VLFVEVTAEQSAADGTGHHPNRPANEGMSDQSAADATGNCADRAVPAAAVTVIIAGVAMVDALVGARLQSQCWWRDHDRSGNQCRQGGRR
jgi:hypothetical protein